MYLMYTIYLFCYTITFRNSKAVIKWTTAHDSCRMSYALSAANIVFLKYFTEHWTDLKWTWRAYFAYVYRNLITCISKKMMLPKFTWILLTLLCFSKNIFITDLVIFTKNKTCVTDPFCFVDICLWNLWLCH